MCFAWHLEYPASFFPLVIIKSLHSWSIAHVFQKFSIAVRTGSIGSSGDQRLGLTDTSFFWHVYEFILLSPSNPSASSLLLSPKTGPCSFTEIHSWHLFTLVEFSMSPTFAPGVFHYPFYCSMKTLASSTLMALNALLYLTGGP